MDMAQKNGENLTNRQNDQKSGKSLSEMRGVIFQISLFLLELSVTINVLMERKPKAGLPAEG